MAETNRVCPECGIDLAGRDVMAHSLTHWPEVLDPAKSSVQARKRKASLEKGGVTAGEFNRSQKEEGDAILNSRLE